MGLERGTELYSREKCQSVYFFTLGALKNFGETRERCAKTVHDNHSPGAKVSQNNTINIDFQVVMLRRRPTGTGFLEILRLHIDIPGILESVKIAFLMMI